MTTLDNPKFLSIITDHIMTQSTESNNTLISMLMKLRCNKAMRRKIETLLSIRLTHSSIDVTSLTKIHRGLRKVNYNMTSCLIKWGIDPFNTVCYGIDPLTIIIPNMLSKTTKVLSAKIEIDELNDDRVITACISQEYNSGDSKISDITMIKITDDMYYQVNIEQSTAKLTPNTNVEVQCNSYIHKVDGIITDVTYHDANASTCIVSYEHSRSTYTMYNGIMTNLYDGHRDLVVDKAIEEAARRTFNYLRIKN